MEELDTEPTLEELSKAIHTLANYRGISFLSVIGKVFAKVILIRL